MDLKKELEKLKEQSKNQNSFLHSAKKQFETEINELIQEDCKLSEKIYRILNPEDDPYETPCGNKRKFNRISTGYSKFCGSIKECKCYKEWNSNLNKNKDYNDINSKKKSTMIDLYGVDNPSKSETIKEKIKRTNLERYGGSAPACSEEIQNKIKETNLKRYNVENVSSSDVVKERRTHTNKKKFGNENVFQSEEIKNKTKETLIEKYGVEYYSQTEEYNEKVKSTSKEKYGFEHYSKTDEYKEQVKSTSKEKYGVEHYSKTDEFRQRVLNSNLEKYNVKHPKQSHNPESFRILNDYNEIIKFKNKSCYDISKELNVSLKTVYDYIKKHNLEEEFIGKQSSYKEQELLEYIKTIYSGTIIEQDRTVLSGKEIDIYLPDIKIGIEFNGTYWHSDKLKDKNYHKNKSKLAKKNDIQILHIHESLWDNKQEQVKERLFHKLKSDNNKIYARKCDIKLISTEDARSFCDQNHIQGFSNATFHLGLHNNNELVAYMSFCSPRKSMNQSGYDYELLRYCTSLNVVGGAGKLFKYFIRNYNPNKIISFSHNDWNSGKVYDLLGFKEKEQTSAGYWYISPDNEMIHRSLFMKHKLIKQGYDSNKTEFQIMDERGYYRYWDSGNTKWEWNK